mgnify:CR=1 FL=1
MNYNENFMFFNEDASAVANATGDGALYKSSDFLGANVTDAAEVTLHFKSRIGTASDDTVVVTQGTTDVKKLMQELTAVLSNPRGGFFVQDSFVKDTNFISDATLAVTTA